MGFFKLVWQSRNEKRMLKAIDKENDQAKLVEIVKSALSDHIRVRALNKIENQSVIADVARNDNNWQVRLRATEMLTDQFALEEIAKNNDRCDIRLAAFKRYYKTGKEDEIFNIIEGILKLSKREEKLFMNRGIPYAYNYLKEILTPVGCKKYGLEYKDVTCRQYDEGSGFYSNTTKRLLYFNGKPVN